MNFLRPLISRALAPFIAAFVAYLAAKGFDLGADAAERITDFTTWFLLAGFLSTSGVVHRLIDRFLNPGDAAGPKLAAKEKREAEALRDA